MEDLATAPEPVYGKTVNITRKNRKDTPVMGKKRYNEVFIELLEELSKFMMKGGEPFRAKAYQKASETIILYPGDITIDNYKALEKEPGIGNTIIEKFDEFIKTGTLRVLERERKDPVNVLSDVYGIGPKKAKELVTKGITTIEELRKNQNELNNVQKVGLHYYEDIMKRIPRSEIDIYQTEFQKAFDSVKSDDSKIEIVGSYRRGVKTSGDIDVIITSKTGDVFKQFIDILKSNGLILEILSRGPSKCLVIGKLLDKVEARRIDFLYTTPDEFPFAILYFTGSKIFNTVMRGHALTMGYSLNEHGLYKMVSKKKGEKVAHLFKDERDIFAFLKLVYKEPNERIDGRAVQTIPGSPKIIPSLLNTNDIIEKIDTPKIIPEKKQITRKKRQTNEEKEEKKKDKLEQNEQKKREKKEQKERAKAEKMMAREQKRAEKEKTRRVKPIVAKNKTIKISPELELVPVIPRLTINEEVEDVKKTGPSPSRKIKTEKKHKEKKRETRRNMKRVLIDEAAIIHAVDHFKKDGSHILENLSEDTLNAMLLKASDVYYNIDENKLLLSDNEYDVLKEYIEQKYPNNKVVKNVGAPVEKNKVTLPYQMPSMDKIKPDTGALQSWQSKYKGPYVLSCKLDGVSGMYTTEITPPALYTRGNGKIGQDISHFIPRLKLPTMKDVVVRGEFIINKKKFNEKYVNKYANARNLVAGIINRISMNEEVDDIEFVAYEVIKPIIKPSEQLKNLEEWGFQTVQNEMRANLTNNELSETLIDWREHYKYEIDGVIVTNDEIYKRTKENPEHSFAFKMVLSDQKAEAKVVDVLWTASKDGYLKPRVQIEPIQLAGVKIEYATGFNAAFIESNKIGVGAIIQMIRSGDVIPYIQSVITPAETALMPSVPYKWNDTRVDILLEDLETNETVREKNITGFFRGIEVDGLSSGNVSRIIAAGFDSIPKILAMTTEDFLTIEGFKEKLSEKIYNGIRTKLDAATIGDIMAASNLFGRGFSDKKIKLILDEYPDILTSKEDADTKSKKLASIKGMASKTAITFVEHIPRFIELLEECKLTNKLFNKPTDDKESSVANIDSSDPLYKKSIVMSGTRDKELEKILESKGASLSGSVTSKTFVLITPDANSTTGKSANARKLNVPILTPEEFRAKYLM